MTPNPILPGIAVFVALITIAPKCPNLGEHFKDYLATGVGAFIAAVFVALSMQP